MGVAGDDERRAASPRICASRSSGVKTVTRSSSLRAVAWQNRTSPSPSTRSAEQRREPVEEVAVGASEERRGPRVGGEQRVLEQLRRDRPVVAHDDEAVGVAAQPVHGPRERRAAARAPRPASGRRRSRRRRRRGPAASASSSATTASSAGRLPWMSHRTATPATSAAAVTGAAQRRSRPPRRRRERERGGHGALEDRAARRGAEVEDLGGAAARRRVARPAAGPARPPVACRPAAPARDRRRGGERRVAGRAEREAADARVLVGDRGRLRGGAARRRGAAPGRRPAPRPPTPICSARQSANCRISLPGTSCITPRPNWAAGPRTRRSVTTVTRVPPSAGSSRVLIVADAVPVRGVARLRLQDRAPGCLVGLLDPDGPAVPAGDRPELDRHRAGVLPAVPAVERGARQARRDPLQVQQHRPRRLHRRGHREGVLQPHRRETIDHR